MAGAVQVRLARAAQVHQAPAATTLPANYGSWQPFEAVHGIQRAVVDSPDMVPTPVSNRTER